MARVKMERFKRSTYDEQLTFGKFIAAREQVLLEVRQHEKRSQLVEVRQRVKG